MNFGAFVAVFRQGRPRPHQPTGAQPRRVGRRRRQSRRPGHGEGHRDRLSRVASTCRARPCSRARTPTPTTPSAIAATAHRRRAIAADRAAEADGAAGTSEATGGGERCADCVNARRYPARFWRPAPYVQPAKLQVGVASSAVERLAARTRRVTIVSLCRRHSVRCRPSAFSPFVREGLRLVENIDPYGVRRCTHVLRITRLGGIIL